MGVTTSAVSLIGATCASAGVPSVSLGLGSPKSWMTTIARSSLLRALSGTITKGHLTIVDGDGSYTFGSYTKGCNVVEFRVVNADFWTRVFMSGDLGFSEAYMIGDVQIDDLDAVMELFIDNQDKLEGLSTVASTVTTLASGIFNAFVGQSKRQARLNAVAAYDQSNELFKAILSKEMMYSCALWGDAEGGVNGDLESDAQPSDLEAAQVRKLHHVLRKARVKPGHRLLEFGSGWGGLAIEAARSFGCEVDTLTLSKEQKALADERIKAAGLEDRIRVHLMDYRDLPPEFEKAFDAFVSIEMVEHVGAKHYSSYFRAIDWALKDKNAGVVITATTRPESRYTTYQYEDFARKYMWPHASVPSATVLVQAADAACPGKFTLEGIENHAAHYPRTLREWGRRVEANLTPEMLAEDFPGIMNPAEFEAFKRKWHYLVAYAGVGFAKGYTTCHMWTFIRQNDAPDPKCY